MKQQITQAKSFPKRFQGLTCYQMILRGFTAEGTLKAATEKLPFLKETGIGIVYLCPIFEADDDTREEYWSPRQKASGFGDPKNPYRIKDYFNVDPEYGNIDDLSAFIARAHELGLYVLFDLVYYHCGPTAKAVTDFPNFTTENGDYSFPRLNFANPALRAYLIANMQYLYSIGADGFRLDCADSVPKDFWIQAKKELGNVYKNSLIVYEGLNPPTKTVDVRYDFDMQIALYAVFNGDMAADEFCKKINPISPNPPRLRCIDNHDIITDGVKERLKDEKSNVVRINSHFSDDQIMAAHAFIETSNGLPMIYNGYEIGSKAPHSLFSNRFYGNMHTDWSVADTENGKKHTAWLKSLCTLRKTTPALYEGETRFVATDEKGKIVCFDRFVKNENAFIRITINVSAEQVFLPFEGDFESSKNAEILLSRLTRKKENGYELQPYAVSVVRIQKES